MKTELVLKWIELLKKINLDKILDKSIGYAFDRNMFYHNSIDSYYSGEEPSFWRKVKFYSRFSVLMIETVKFGLSTLFPNTLLLTPLTDATIIFGKEAILLNAVLFSLFIITLLIKLIFVHYESHNNIKVFDIVYDLKASKQKYRVSKNYVSIGKILK